ncbi:unnamed protein product [Mucor hiemalis]
MYNPQNMEECYWKAKEYQRKASRFNEKRGIDKMIKHNSIFTLSNPTPSEADVIIKIWADIFEVLFYSTGIYVRWLILRLLSSIMIYEYKYDRYFSSKYFSRQVSLSTLYQLFIKTLITLLISRPLISAAYFIVPEGRLIQTPPRHPLPLGEKRLAADGDENTIFKIRLISKCKARGYSMGNSSVRIHNHYAWMIAKIQKPINNAEPVQLVAQIGDELGSYGSLGNAIKSIKTSVKGVCGFTFRLKKVTEVNSNLSVPYEPSFTITSFQLTDTTNVASPPIASSITTSTVSKPVNSELANLLNNLSVDDGAPAMTTTTPYTPIITAPGQLLNATTTTAKSPTKQTLRPNTRLPTSAQARQEEVDE